MNSLRDELFQVPAYVIAAIFCVMIFTLNWLGHRTRKAVAKRNPEKEISLGTAEGSLMGLMALALAFTFNMSSTKYESRRQTIIEEANILNTASLRLSLYPDSIRKDLLVDFRNYVDSRISYFDAVDNRVKIDGALRDSDKHFADLWSKNASLTNDPTSRSKAEQLAPVLISMKNMVTTREAGRVSTVPTLIIFVLLVLVFVASFLTGYGVKPGNRNPVFSLAFALMTAVVLYVIMELGRPRQGYINLENAQKAILNVRHKLS